MEIKRYILPTVEYKFLLVALEFYRNSPQLSKLSSFIRNFYEIPTHCISVEGIGLFCFHLFCFAFCTWDGTHDLGLARQVIILMS